jgi:hypothetical protein
MPDILLPLPGVDFARLIRVLRHPTTMSVKPSSSLLRSAFRVGLSRAYKQVQVDPKKYLEHLRSAHRLPVRSYEDMFFLGPDALNPHAHTIIRASSTVGAFEGMGFGLGGALTIVPDLGVLATITIRLLQKLSLLYGFNYQTEDEEIELWLAAATAAGLDLGREFVEKQAIERIVPRIIDRVAVKVGAEMAEEWVGRFVPVVSAGIAGTLNYYFVRTWGRRAQKHFEERHCSVRNQKLLELPPAGSSQPLAPA